MEKLKIFTLSQISQHKSKSDCWFVINGRVLDVTKFLEEHPGGEEILVESAGKDATKEFENVGHSAAAKNLLLKYQIGYLQGHKIQENGNSKSDNDVAGKESKHKEMKAFVIKDTPRPKYVAFLEFFIPLLVSCAFFWYRNIAGTYS